MMAQLSGVFVGGLLLVMLAVKFFGWLAAAGAVVVLLLALRALSSSAGERKAVAAREAEEIAYRADRQHQWARRGDDRGVYGDVGAELMRSIAPEPPPMASDVPNEELSVAALATTPDGLTVLIAEKPTGWRWAAFASVLVQRRAAVQSRLRDCALGYATPAGTPAHSGMEVGRFVTGRMEDLCDLVGQVEAFMFTPAFMEVFGSRCDESTADAEGIMHVANRLMDYHDRFLKLAERCRDFQAPAAYAVLLRDTRQLMAIPLDAYRTFIDDFVDRIAEMPELLRYGRGTVEADPVVLHMRVDDRLMQRISKQLRAAART